MILFNGFQSDKYYKANDFIGVKLEHTKISNVKKKKRSMVLQTFDTIWLKVALLNLYVNVIIGDELRNSNRIS